MRSRRELHTDSHRPPHSSSGFILALAAVGRTIAAGYLGSVIVQTDQVGITGPP